MDEPVGLIIPVFPGERRVALLPQHTHPGMLVEAGYAATLGIPDAAYEQRGCRIASRGEIYAECRHILNLKLTPGNDYPMLRERQAIWGWTHPNGSGAQFAQGIARGLHLALYDLDSVHPAIFEGDAVTPLPIPSGFLRGNSWIAGYAAVMHAAQAHGLLLDATVRVAVLGTGAVAQGSLAALHHTGAQLVVFNRRTLPTLNVAEFDVLVSGVESDAGTLVTEQQLATTSGLLIVDAAADAGGTIHGSRFTTVNRPTYQLGGHTYYCVNNTPTLYHRTASRVISEALHRHVVPLMLAAA